MLSSNNTLVTRTLSQSDWETILSSLRSVGGEATYLANKLNLPQCEGDLLPNKIRELEGELNEWAEESLNKSAEIKTLRTRLFKCEPMSIDTIDFKALLEVKKEGDEE